MDEKRLKRRSFLQVAGAAAITGRSGAGFLGYPAGKDSLSRTGDESKEDSAQTSETIPVEGQPSGGTIHFDYGEPSADLLPLDLMRKATNAFYEAADPLDLNYGALPGDRRFRHSLASFLTRYYGKPCDPGNLFLTAGISQALDFICSHVSKPGDTIIVEEPSYFLAYQIFIDHGLKIVSVPVDQDGLDINALEETLATTKAALLYTIPGYQNPSGRTMSMERRKRLIELSHEHDFLILADEVYQLLSYYDSPPDALGTMVEGGSVLSFGSFSKILAPALRLGWIQASNDRVKQFTNIGAINSGGSLNHFTSHIVRHAMDLGLLQAHLEKLRTTYRRRVEVMDAALKEHLGGRATWIKPDGGYFFWLKLDKDTSALALRRRAREMKVGFHAGELFSSTNSFKNYIRLSFSHYNERDIREGIARLRSLFA